jgi:hypothetical protein
MKPEARRERLLIEELGDELIVYDLQRHRVHQLNRTAALVWQSCDGKTSVAELKEILQEELSPAIDETIVWETLHRLGKARLLQDPVPRPAGKGSMTRRQALNRLGRTAALALLMPAIVSITSPTPARADGQEEDDCESDGCRTKCADQCGGSTTCATGMRCRTVSCKASGCEDCTQKRCVKQKTQPDEGEGGDGGDGG